MTTLPKITGKKIIATLKKAGFSVIRIKGSHHSFPEASGWPMYPGGCPCRRNHRQWFDEQDSP